MSTGVKEQRLNSYFFMTLWCHLNMHNNYLDIKIIHNTATNSFISIVKCTRKFPIELAKLMLTLNINQTCSVQGLGSGNFRLVNNGSQT